MLLLLLSSLKSGSSFTHNQKKSPSMKYYINPIKQMANGRNLTLSRTLHTAHIIPLLKRHRYLLLLFVVY